MTTDGQPPLIPSAPAAPAGAGMAKPLRLAMLAFVLAFGALGYAWIGQPQAWSVGPESAPGGPHISAMVESLAARLRANPDNPQGWAMLARSYTVLGQLDQAEQAYRRLMALRPQDAQVLADLADVVAMRQGRDLEGEPAKLIEQALARDARNVKALFLAGTLAFDRHDDQQAIAYWEQAEQYAPSSQPEWLRPIRGALDEARALNPTVRKP